MDVFKLIKPKVTTRKLVVPNLHNTLTYVVFFSFSDCKAPSKLLTLKKDTLTLTISEFAMPKNLSPKKNAT